jgi:hypothetical protein
MDGKTADEYIIDNTRISTTVGSSKNTENFEAVSPLRVSMSLKQPTDTKSTGQESVRGSVAESTRFSRASRRPSQQKFVDSIFERNYSFINDEVEILSGAISPFREYVAPIVDNVNKHGRDGTEGDHPFPRGFARTKEFWKLIIVSGFMAVVLSFAAVAFTSCIDNVPPEWATCEYGVDRSCGNWYTGKLYWIPLSGGAGLIVGLMRYFFSYPDNLPGFFKEIRDCYVNPRWVCLTYIISAISIGGGATLGPEQALGNVGGGLACFVLEHFVSFEEEYYQKMFVLSGIVAPLGALLPNPMLAVTLLMELGESTPYFMETIIILAIPATISFSVYFGMIGYSYLNYLSSSSINLSQEWLTDPGFKGYMIMTGFAVGCVRLRICDLTFITDGFFKNNVVSLPSQCSFVLDHAY